MEQGERRMGHSFSTRGTKVYRLARIRRCGVFSPITARCYGNGQGVMRPYFLIWATGRCFGGSLLRAAMGGCMSHRTRVLSSSKVIMVRQERKLGHLTSS